MIFDFNINSDIQNWNVVDDKNLAHFIIVLTIEKRGMGVFKAWATFKTIDGKEFKTSKSFKKSIYDINRRSLTVVVHNYNLYIVQLLRGNYCSNIGQNAYGGSSTSNGMTS